MRLHLGKKGVEREHLDELTVCEYRYVIDYCEDSDRIDAKHRPESCVSRAVEDLKPPLFLHEMLWRFGKMYTGVQVMSKVTPRHAPFFAVVLVQPVKSWLDDFDGVLTGKYICSPLPVVQEAYDVLCELARGQPNPRAWTSTNNASPDAGPTVKEAIQSAKAEHHSGIATLREYFELRTGLSTGGGLLSHDDAMEKLRNSKAKV